jgi:hypothetical protein
VRVSVELQKFITFTVTTQVTQLKVELKSDIGRVELRLDGLERKMDGHHEAMKLILGDILSRLPPRRG